MNCFHVVLNICRFIGEAILTVIFSWSIAWSFRRKPDNSVQMRRLSSLMTCRSLSSATSQSFSICWQQDPANIHCSCIQHASASAWRSRLLSVSIVKSFPVICHATEASQISADESCFSISVFLLSELVCSSHIALNLAFCSRKCSEVSASCCLSSIMRSNSDCKFNRSFLIKSFSIARQSFSKCAFLRSITSLERSAWYLSLSCAVAPFSYLWHDTDYSASLSLHSWHPLCTWRTVICSFCCRLNVFQCFVLDLDSRCYGILQTLLFYCKF